MNAESNLLNVSEYMKDIMTAYLPIFEKQLNIMCNQAELIKSLIENTRLKVAGTAPGVDDPSVYNNVRASQVKSDGVALTLKQLKAGNEAESKGHFLTLLSSIIATSKSLQSCVKNVYKELADIPLYFETYQNSITDYKNRNGVLPLMPLSQVSHLLNNQHRLVPGADKPVQASINTKKFGGVSEPLLQVALKALNFNTAAGILNATNLANTAAGAAVAADATVAAADVDAVAAVNAGADVRGIVNATTTADAGAGAAVAAVGGGVGDGNIAPIAVGILTAATDFAVATAATAAALVSVILIATRAKTADDSAKDAVDAAVRANANNNIPVSATALLAANALVILTTTALLEANNAVAETRISNTYLNDAIRVAAIRNANARIALIAARVAAGGGGMNAPEIADTTNDIAAIKLQTAEALRLSTISLNQALQAAAAVNACVAPAAQLRVATAAARLTNANILRIYNIAKDNLIMTAFDNIKADDLLRAPPEKLDKTLVKLIDTDILMVAAGVNGANKHRRYTGIGAGAGFVAANEPIIDPVDITKWIVYITNLAKSTPPTAARITPPAGVGGPGANRYRYYSCKGLIPHQDVGVGSDEFKFAYGTRGLLSDTNEPNVEMAPGVIGVLDIYNSKVGGAASYDKRKMVDSFVNSTHLLRFATDYIYHKTYLCNNDLDKLTEFYLVGTAAAVITPAVAGANLVNRNILQHLSCQTGRHSFNDTDVVATGLIPANNEFFRVTSNITLLTENDNYKQSVYRMLRCIIDSNLSEHMHEQDRTQLRIYNILDSNIVPINFHALQREIALINIYNYSYTFDHMIKQFIGVETASRTLEQIKLSDGGMAPIGTVGELVALGGVTKIGYYPEDALVRILIQPQGKRYVKDYVDNIWKLMAGNDSLSLNRPKYLSDQLWNKVLLNSLYSNAGVTGLDAVPNIDRINVGNKGSNTSRTMQIGHMTRSAALAEPLDAVGAITEPVNFGFEQITYISNNAAAPMNKHDFTPVSVGFAAGAAGVAAMSVWHNCGYARYQTIIVRYIEWFVHLQRVMRLLMRDQLTWVNDPIVHKSNALSNEITEYESNNKFEMSDFE
jgi:hypothetical protein